MSELIDTGHNTTITRWQLLATVSAIALLGAAYGVGNAKASDGNSDNPTVWIELGGQLSRLDEPQDAFVPPIMNARPSMFSPSQPFEKLPLYSFDETGKISIEPTGTDWVFSAAVRYGRSTSRKNVLQQTHPAHFHTSILGSSINKYPAAEKFADTNVHNDEQHLLVDFQVGKDVGLGLFGHGSSTVNLGVRFAQFISKSNVALKSDPDWHFIYVTKYGYNAAHQSFHSNIASLQAARSFHGVGPLLSWNASTPLAGNTHDGELTVDWGLNAAVLFGRQRTEIHHQVTGKKEYVVGAPLGSNAPYVTYQPAPVDRARSRSVIVPNVGGFAGITYRMDSFKMSAGYKADFFFGAMDGGIDARQTKDVGFFGPYATISIGLGG